MSPRFEVRVGSVTDAGRVRDHNEDSLWVGSSVFCVADGMGGHRDGAAASAIVAECFAELDANAWVMAGDIDATVERAGRRVAALGGAGLAPGSTVTGVALSHQNGVPCWRVFNVGDSRTYLMHDGRLELLTVDHRAISQRQGARFVITRALGGGIKRPPTADQWLVPAAAGHRVLVCSDGLTGEVTDELIQATLMSPAPPQTAAQELVAAANAAGGRDNVSVVIVDALVVQGDAAGVRDDTQSDDTEHDPIDSEGAPA